MSAPPLQPRPLRLLDRVRRAAQLRHLSPRTQEAYVAWVRRFVLFHGKRHPGEMGVLEVVAFLSHLAVERRVAASTQSQALAALLFLYRVVLERELQGLDGAVRARRSTRLPVVLSREEVRQVLARLDGTHRLVATLLYVGERLQLTPNSSFRSIRGIVLAAGAVPQRWRSALLGAAEPPARYTALKPISDAKC